MSSINVHISRSVVPGSSAAHENQAISTAKPNSACVCNARSSRQDTLFTSVTFMTVLAQLDPYCQLINSLDLYLFGHSQKVRYGSL